MNNRLRISCQINLNLILKRLNLYKNISLNLIKETALAATIAEHDAAIESLKSDHQADLAAKLTAANENFEFTKTALAAQHDAAIESLKLIIKKL